MECYAKSTIALTFEIGKNHGGILRGEVQEPAVTLVSSLEMSKSCIRDRSAPPKKKSLLVMNSQDPLLTRVHKSSNEIKMM